MMKIHIFILLLLSVFVSAQNFKFDYFIEAESKIVGSKEKATQKYYFFDTENGNVFHIVQENEPGNFLGTLIDFDAQLLHIFDGKNQDGNMDFKYMHSTKILNRSPKAAPIVEIHKLGDSVFNLKVFADGNKKKKQFDSQIVLEKSPENVLFIDFDPKSYFKTSNLLHEKLDSGSGYRVKEMTTQYGNGKIQHNKILKMEKRPFQIHIEKINLKKL